MERVNKEENPTLWMFLLTLKRLRIVILQDVATLMNDGKFFLPT
jgi:hypothetical protein